MPTRYSWLGDGQVSSHVRDASARLPRRQLPCAMRQAAVSEGGLPATKLACAAGAISTTSGEWLSDQHAQPGVGAPRGGALYLLRPAGIGGFDWGDRRDPAPASNTDDFCYYETAIRINIKTSNEMSTDGWLTQGAVTPQRLACARAP